MNAETDTAEVQAERRRVLAEELASRPARACTRTVIGSQPCGCCRRPVLPSRGRRPGETWWCATTECRAARWRSRHRLRPRRTQPCGHCGRPVNPGGGRRPGRTWWHLNEACQRARVREAKAAARARLADRREAAGAA